MNYKNFFKDRKVAVVGLGRHGEMVADVKFLLKSGTQVSLHDIRSEARLAGHLKPLIDSGFTNFTLGKTPGEELLSAELIILSPEISKKSLFLKKATEAGIPIEYPEIFFLKSAPSITLVGIMGECGKSTVAHMLYSILKQSFAEYDGQGLFFIDPDLPHGALTHFKKIKAGDVVLARIPEQMMKEYYGAHVSPHVAVITTPTKSYSILEHQTYNNFIVAPNSVVDAIKASPHPTSKAKILRTRPENSALALQAAELFKVNAEMAQKVLQSFNGLKAHQELVKKIHDVEFYNDSASVTPLATLAALRTLSFNKNIVLILGGAYTGYDYDTLIREIPTYASTVILLPGTGSLGIRTALSELFDIKFLFSPTLEDAVVLAKSQAKKGDRVLFSPGFDAVGIHLSRKERGEKFVKAVRSL